MGREGMAVRKKRIFTVCDAECKCPPEWFLPFEEMTEETQKALSPIECEGSGQMGMACYDCQFGNAYNWYVDSEEDIE